jgi:agmatinase
MNLVEVSEVRQFIGSEVKKTYQDSQVVIVPIPYEATTTYRKGCEKGPDALIDASDQLELYDEELQKEVGLELGIYTYPSIADTRQDPSMTAEKMLQETTEVVKKLIQDQKFAIAIGGEHAITTGVVQAYRETLTEAFTVVQIDAHGDMRYSYHDSLHNHACVMRRVLEMGLPTLPVAIRSICQEEAELIKEKQIPVVWDRDIASQPDWIETAISRITTPKVFITIDVDGIDPSLMPAVGTPEPGGLSWYGLLRFLRRVFETHEVIGCDVMELAPLEESVVSEFTAAKLVYKLIGYYGLSRELAAK